MITIVDYGMGNLRSVRRACVEVGFDVQITNNADDVRNAEKIILPGVGAFGEAVKRIDGLGLRSVLLDTIGRGTPLLGICLGMQLLFETSEESYGAKGLAVLQGNVIRLSHGVKTPHIGWNDVQPRDVSSLFRKENQPLQTTCFYFVHSYYVPASSATIATTEYGVTFSSAVQKENVVGVQFHPEKSQEAGLSVLKSFGEM